MKEMAAEYAVEELAEALEVCRSGYYAWQSRPPSVREQNNVTLLEEIKVVHKESRQNYGSPRVTRELHDRGICCGENRVARLMRKDGLQGVQKKRFRPKTTDSDHDYPISPNRLAEIEEIAQPNQAWAADITYIPTHEGWLYLAGVMDLCTRRIVGWAMEESMATDLVSEALLRALHQQEPSAGLIHHSDRGCQYASHDYQDTLREHGIEGSMGRVGNCYDNATMESFWGTLKTELTRGKPFRSKRQARLEIFEYIEVFYNRKRLHSSIGYQSPVRFELNLRSKRN